MTVARWSIGLGAVLGTAAVAACGRDSLHHSATIIQADAKAIEAAVGRYVEASNQGDAEALGALYTEDAMLLPPDHPPIEGRRAIVDFWERGTDHDLRIITVRVDVHGDLGYLVGWYSLPATPEEPADSGKYLLCLRRQPNGAWKVAADIWNSSADPDAHDHDHGPQGDGEHESRPPRWPLS